MTYTRKEVIGDATKMFLGGKVELHSGDCRRLIAALPDASIDSVVTDPPYSLVSIVKRFGKENSAPAKSDGATGVYARASSGFMGKQWDTGETAFAVEFWAQVLRVLKTGDILQGSTVRNDIRGGAFASGHKPNPGDIAPYEQSALGRWPANLCHDGSPEVMACFPSEAGAFAPVRGTEPSLPANGDVVFGFRSRVGHTHHGDSGSAARFFFTAKADASDRIASKHPTVKPLDLMQWLCRLVTPKGGTILDPFAGTGTTGEAAWREGFRAILIEREAEYQADIARRMDLAEKPSKRAAVAKTKGKIDDHGPLFSTEAAE